MINVPLILSAALQAIPLSAIEDITAMNAPKIDLSALPGLETAQGLYGSATQMGGAYEESIIAIMVYVYDSGVTGIVG